MVSGEPETDGHTASEAQPATNGHLANGHIVIQSLDAEGNGAALEETLDDMMKRMDETRRMLRELRNGSAA